MADEIITREELVDAKVDAKDLGECVNGNESGIVTPRLGDPYPTLPAAIHKIENVGGYISAPTLTALQAITPTYNHQLARDDSTGDEYRWNPAATPPQWVPTGRNYLNDAKADATAKANAAEANAKNYANNRIPLDAYDALDMREDIAGFVYAYTTKDGQLKLVGMSGGVQENINTLVSQIFSRDDGVLNTFLDKSGNVVAYTDLSSNLHVAGQIFQGGESLSTIVKETPKNLDRTACLAYQTSLISKYPPRSEFTSVMTRAESNGLRNRMISAIKVPTGLFMVWHQQTKAEYDGDGSGSAFWCGFADIDSSQNITIRDKKLFIYPDTDAGIVKHPHLGRTSDNRIILVYEKSVGYAEATPENPVNYIRYVKYSSDEGVTWTDPVALTFINNPPTTALKALGTTSEVLRLKSGRLIVALYSTLGQCGCIYSDNDGATWSYSQQWIREQNWGTEPCINLDSNGHLIMSMRPMQSTQMFAGFARSVDEGETWQLVHTDKLVSVVSQSFLLYDDALGLHIESHDTNSSNQRTRFRLSLSYDDCNTFSLHFAPFQDTRYVGYTQLIKWIDGVYLLLMEYNDIWSGVNSNEDLGIQLFTISEIMNNVSRN
ncbi:sialidase family protein [Acinetobacter baumannii]